MCQRAIVGQVVVIVAPKDVDKVKAMVVCVANQSGAHLVARISVLSANDCHDAVLANIWKNWANVTLNLSGIQLSIVRNDL